MRETLMCALQPPLCNRELVGCSPPYPCPPSGPGTAAAAPALPANNATVMPMRLQQRGPLARIHLRARELVTGRDNEGHALGPGIAQQRAIGELQLPRVAEEGQCS
jgi:hypothetical protein